MKKAVKSPLDLFHSNLIIFKSDKSKKRSLPTLQRGAQRRAKGRKK